MSYLYRALIVWGVSSAAGAFLYRSIRRAGWVRSAANAIAASLLVLALAWVLLATQPIVAILGPLGLFGLPAALWQLVRHRTWQQALRVLAAWAGAALPAELLLQPWF